MWNRFPPEYVNKANANDLYIAHIFCVIAHFARIYAPQSPICISVLSTPHGIGLNEEKTQKKKQNKMPKHGQMAFATANKIRPFARWCLHALASYSARLFHSLVPRPMPSFAPSPTYIYTKRTTSVSSGQQRKHRLTQSQQPPCHACHTADTTMMAFSSNQKSRLFGQVKPWQRNEHKMEMVLQKRQADVRGK